MYDITLLQTAGHTYAHAAGGCRAPMIHCKLDCGDFMRNALSCMMCNFTVSLAPRQPHVHLFEHAHSIAKQLWW